MDKKLLAMNEPILITGCARSGTSMVAGIINICGAFGGKMYGPTRYNQKGYFENSYIRKQLQKEYLRSIGADTQGQFPLPATESMRIPVNFRQNVLTQLQREGCRRGKWFYKDATICLNWPVWHCAFPKAKWVIVRRPDEDIVESCLNTPFMSKYSDKEGWQSWVNHHNQCFEEMHNAGLNIREVWSNKIVEIGNFSEIMEVVTWAGLEWDGVGARARKFVDERLWKSNRKELV